MGANTKIEWCDHTWNAWEGCTKVSPGCANCYAEALRDLRYGAVKWGKGQPRRRTSEANWRKPLQWNHVARPSIHAWRKITNFEGIGTGWTHECSKCRAVTDAKGAKHHANQNGCAALSRPRVFCASLADWLDDEVPIEWLADLISLIHATPNLDWLLLTKRPENWRERISRVGSFFALKGHGPHQDAGITLAWLNGLAPTNIWIGTTVEDQTRADERIPHLLQIPANVRFLSCEPLLGPVELNFGHSWKDKGSRNGIPVHDFTPNIHWVIAGGESGHNARPMHPDWARSLRDQCAASGVPFLFKQWGEYGPTKMAYPPDFSDIALNDADEIACTTVFDGQREVAYPVQRLGKKKAGRLLDGVEHNGFPSPRT